MPETILLLVKISALKVGINCCSFLSLVYSASLDQQDATMTDRLQAFACVKTVTEDNYCVPTLHTLFINEENLTVHECFVYSDNLSSP